MGTSDNRFQDIRDGLRALCAEFPDEYFRKIDEARGYPDAFVDALTKAGWLAALIPQEYGGLGVGLPGASAFIGGTHSVGRNSGPCPGPRCNIGSIVFHRPVTASDKLLPRCP